MPGDHIELTREDLYDMVWSEPMRVIAPRLGITDTGLAKICRRLKVPRPGRGYWQRSRVGKRDRRPTLRPLPPGARSKVIIRRAPAPADAEETGPVPEQRRFESQPENRIAVPQRVGRYHPLVVQTRLALRAKRSLGYQDPRSPKGLDIDVSPSSLRRALRIMDALIKALEHRGMTVRVGGDDGTTIVDVRGVPVRMALEERYRSTLLPPTPKDLEYEQRYGWTPRRRCERERDGNLALRILEWPPEGQRKAWTDGKRQRVENCLNAFVAGLVVVSEAKKALELERQEWERKYIEAELKREEERRRAELERARIEELRCQVTAWDEARRSREYVAAARELTDGLSSSSELMQKWLSWAEGYIQRLDPLTDPSAIPAVMTAQPG